MIPEIKFPIMNSLISSSEERLSCFDYNSCRVLGNLKYIVGKLNWGAVAFKAIVLSLTMLYLSGVKEVNITSWKDNCQHRRPRLGELKL